MRSGEAAMPMVSVACSDISTVWPTDAERSIPRAG